MRIGVISDTHDFFDPQINVVFAGVEHIIHGGDIGRPRILADLERIAAVTAVAGNTDEAGFRYRETECVELAKLKFLVHHIVAPHHLADGIRASIERERPDIVVFGHTHKPFAQWIGKTLFFNPGSAGKSRFGMERTLAILNCDSTGLTWEYKTL